MLIGLLFFIYAVIGMQVCLVRILCFFFRIGEHFFRFEFLGDELLCVLLIYILYLSCKLSVQIKVVSLFLVGVGTRLLLVLSSLLPALPLFRFATPRWRQDAQTNYLTLSRKNVKPKRLQVTEPCFDPI